MVMASRNLAAINGRGLFKVLRGADGATLYEFDTAAFTMARPNRAATSR
jgi:hypothetical protein